MEHYKKYVYGGGGFLLLLFISVIGLQQGGAWRFDSTHKYPQELLRSDTVQVLSMYQKAQEQLQEGDAEKALELAQYGLQLAKKMEYTKGKVLCLYVLGKASKYKGDYEIAQNYYVDMLAEIDKVRGINMTDIYTDVGMLYRDWGALGKSIDYFEKAYTLKSKNTDEQNLEVLRHLAQAYIQVKNYDKVLTYYKASIAIYKKNNNRNGLVTTLRSMSDIYEHNQQIDKALESNIEILGIKNQMRHEVKDDVIKLREVEEGIASYLNNIGYLYEKQKNYQQALNYFEDALKLNQKLKKSETENVVILRNIGVMYQYLRNYEKSIDYFNKALIITQKNNDVKGVSTTCNYIATIYQGLGDFGRAEEYALKAVEISEKNNNRDDVLEKSYNRLSEIYNLTGKHRQALIYYQKYAAIKENAMQEQINKLTQQLTQQSKVDEVAQKYKEALAEKALDEAKLRTLELEKTQKDNEYALLLSNQRLEQEASHRKELEKERELQNVSIARQRLEAQLKDKEFRQLEQEKELSDILAQQQEKARLDYEKELERAKKETNLQKQILEDSKRLETYYNGLIALFGVIIFLMLISYYFKRKANLQLQRQQEQILAQRDAIEDKNKVLNLQQTEILKKNAELELQKQEVIARKDEIEKSYDNMAVISEIGQEITATLDLDKIINIVYSHVSVLMSADKFGVGLYIEEKNRVDYALYIDKGKKLKDVSFSTKEERIATWVALNRKPVFMNNIREEYPKYLRNLDAYKAGTLSEAIICLPLIVEEKVIGLINVQSEQVGAYSQYHLDMLQTLASYVSIAIDNSNIYSNLKDANEIIKESNQKITDSIRYAQTIQEAVLPSNDKIKSVLKDFFVIFRPKDIVSGDFYWFSHVNNKTFLAVVDCTGHGVPGAFMSMVGNDLLDEIVNLERVYEPALILKMLHLGIYRTLKQELGKNDDGMDVCLCCIDYENHKVAENEALVTFAGAKRPLFYVHKGEVKTIKGSNIPIGGGFTSTHQKSFVNHSIVLGKGDMVYMSTDGFIDQNNHQRTKFGTTQFMDLLAKIHNRDVKSQQSLMISALETHQGTELQRDDITIFSIKI